MKCHKHHGVLGPTPDPPGGRFTAPVWQCWAESHSPVSGSAQDTQLPAIAEGDTAGPIEATSALAIRYTASWKDAGEILRHDRGAILGWLQRQLPPGTSKVSNRLSLRSTRNLPRHFPCDLADELLPLQRSFFDSVMGTV